MSPLGQRDHRLRAKSRLSQATSSAGTIGHVAHGKSTVVKAISGVHTVRFKNELERNITIKLGYANAKIYECPNPVRAGCALASEFELAECTSVSIKLPAPLAYTACGTTEIQQY